MQKRSFLTYLFLILICSLLLSLKSVGNLLLTSSRASSCPSFLIYLCLSLPPCFSIYKIYMLITWIIKVKSFLKALFHYTYQPPYNSQYMSSLYRSETSSIASIPPVPQGQQSLTEVEVVLTEVAFLYVKSMAKNSFVFQN